MVTTPAPDAMPSPTPIADAVEAWLAAQDAPGHDGLPAYLDFANDADAPETALL